MHITVTHLLTYFLQVCREKSTFNFWQYIGLKANQIHTLYITNRDRLIRLHDLNNDGEADFYENFNGDCEVARHYRAGHDIADRAVTGQATTEDLRQAMIHYEALFSELVSESEPAGREREPVPT